MVLVSAAFAFLFLLVVAWDKILRQSARIYLNHTTVVPNGGYLTTVILNATTHYFTHHPEARRWNQPHAIHCALTFSTRCSTGPCTVRVTLFKAGRQYSIVRVALLQQGSKNVCIDATVTHTNMSLEAGATLPTRGMRMYYGGGGNDCATASGDGASGGGGASSVPDRVRDCEVQHDHAANFRRASKKVEQMFPRGSVFGSRSQQPSIQEQWVALRDGSGAGFGLTGLGFVNDIVRIVFSPPGLRLTVLYSSGRFQRTTTG